MPEHTDREIRLATGTSKFLEERAEKRKLNTHKDKKLVELAELFKMLSKRGEEQKKIKEGLKETKKLKKRVKQKKLSSLLSERIREDVSGKRTKRKRTSIDNTTGKPPHSHLYSPNDIYTSTNQNHKHKISKNGKTALSGKTGHTHKLK